MPFLDRRNDDRNFEALLWAGDEYRPATLQEPGLDGTSVSASLIHAQRRLCGNPDCTSGWTMPWRSRRRPVFEGQWGCGGRCVLAIVRDVLRREAGEGRIAGVENPHRHRVPLGLLMLAQGWITPSQLRQALAAQRQNGRGRIGEWLVSECGLEPEQVSRGLGMQWNCPVLGMEGFSPEAMALVMPRIFVEQFGLLPLRTTGGRILYLAFEDRLDASVSLAVEQMTGIKVECGILNEAQLRVARTRLLQCNAVETKIEAASDVDILAGRITAILEQKRPVASRIVRLHQYYWLRLWLENGTRGKSGKLPASSEDMNDFVFTVGTQV